MSFLLIRRLEAIRNEYAAARALMKLAERSWPQISDEREMQGIRYPHFRDTVRNLEITYFIRLFAAFEGLLRHYLMTTNPGRPLPRRAEELINRAARRARIPDPIRDGAQEVREYRNSIVHPGAVAMPLTFEQGVGD